MNYKIIEHKRMVLNTQEIFYTIVLEKQVGIFFKRKKQFTHGYMLPCGDDLHNEPFKFSCIKHAKRRLDNIKNGQCDFCWWDKFTPSRKIHKTSEV